MSTIRIIRRAEVLNLVGWSTSTLYQKISEGRFPRQVNLDDDGRAVGWLEHEIETYLKDRIGARDRKIKAK